MLRCSIPGESRLRREGAFIFAASRGHYGTCGRWVLDGKFTEYSKMGKPSPPRPLTLNWHRLTQQPKFAGRAILTSLGPVETSMLLRSSASRLQSALQSKVDLPSSTATGSARIGLLHRGWR